MQKQRFYCDVKCHAMQYLPYTHPLCVCTIRCIFEKLESIFGLIWWRAKSMIGFWTSTLHFYFYTIQYVAARTHRNLNSERSTDESRDAAQWINNEANANCQSIGFWSEGIKLNLNSQCLFYWLLWCKREITSQKYGVIATFTGCSCRRSHRLSMKSHLRSHFDVCLWKDLLIST